MRRATAGAATVGWRSWVALWVLGILGASAGLVGWAGEPAGQAGLPKPLPPEVVAAWEKAGATVRWLRFKAGGALVFVTGEPAKAGDLPAFRFDRWTDVQGAKLPDPAVPFGLDLFAVQVTDEGLKALAGLKSLQVLILSDTPVTDEGLKQLAGLTNLQSLWLGNTSVTDEGLKELAGLKSLQSLFLYNTGVNGTGLKALAGSKSLQLLNLGGSPVTDAGLKALAGSKSLQLLNLGSTG